MTKIFFRNEQVEAVCGGGKTLMAAFRENGIRLETPCNGNGTCGKCRVSVAEKPGGGKRDVLACRYRLGETDITVDTTATRDALVSVDRGKSMPIGTDFDTRIQDAGVLDFDAQEPYINKLHTGNASLAVLKKIAALEKERTASPLYAVFYDAELLDILKSDRRPEPLGLAVDLGTTGVSVMLLSLGTGEVLETASFLNPQFQYGGDVLTRVRFCMEGAKNTRALQRLVIDKLNDTLAAFSEKGCDPRMIYRVAVAGNTIMQHIFAGIEPSLLAKNPYRPIFNGALDLRLPELSVNENAVITVLPAISSYVGGDIAAGIISTGFYLHRGNALFLDIGTNGEIALMRNGRLWCTSTAAGPALEGMNISCGQRAVAGAIETFFTDENGDVAFSTIGGGKATGICGSGLIDLTAILLRKGLIDSSGRLSGKKYAVDDDISVTQKDVRQIQLAKGAIAAGIKMLLDEAGGRCDEIDAIYIAGSFGAHLNAENLKAIGMIDPSFSGEIRFVGNSSLEGARLALVNKNILRLMREITEKGKAISLSDRETFQEIFVNELRFNGKK